MARHLMTVCVVCLLCAQHLPCKQHFDDDNSLQNPKILLQDDYGQMKYIKRDEPTTDALYGNNLPYDAMPKVDSIPHKRKGRTKNRSNNGPAATAATLNRVKRHGDHNHDAYDHEEHPEDRVGVHYSDAFVKKIFAQFGDAEKLTMDVHGFEKMIKHLELYRLVDDHHTDTREHKHESKEKLDKGDTINNITVSYFKEILKF